MWANLFQPLRSLSCEDIADLLNECVKLVNAVVNMPFLNVVTTMIDVVLDFIAAQHGEVNPRAAYGT